MTDCKLKINVETTGDGALINDTLSLQVED